VTRFGVTNTRLSRVMVAHALFCVIEYSYWTAVLLLAYQEGGPAIAGAVLLVQLLPAALLAAPLGSLVDRLPRGTAVALAHALMASTLTVLTIAVWAGASLPVIVILSSLATIAFALPRPLHFAALPQLASTARGLVRSNSASTFLEGVGVFVGPAIAGALILISGTTTVIAASAVAAAIAALLCLRLRLPHVNAPDGADDGALAGIRLVSHDRPVLALLLLAAVSFVVTGTFEILGIAFATDVLNGDEAVAGLVMGAEGIGLLIGSALALGVTLRPRLLKPVAVAFAAAGLPLLVMVAVGTLPLAMFLLALCGTGIAMSAVAARSLLQRTTDGTVLARVFAVQESVTLFGLTLGALMAPLFVKVFGAQLAYLPLGIILIITPLLALPALRALDRRAVFRPDVVRLLRGVPFLVGMSPPSLEYLAQKAQWIDVEPGQALVQQGHVNEVLFVVDSGQLALDVDGVRVHVFEKGEAFEESALAQASPSTGTLIALTHAQVLAISRGDFIRSTVFGISTRSLAGLLSEDATEARAVAALTRAPADKSTLSAQLGIEPTELGQVLESLVIAGVISLDNDVYSPVFGRRRGMGTSVADNLYPEAPD